MIKRVLRSLNALFWGQVIARVGSLLLVPLFLSKWGAGIYGEYLSILALVTYLGTIDLGLSQATINRLTQSFVRDDRPDYLKVLHSAFAFYAGIAFIGTVILGLAAYFLPLHRWLGLKTLGPTVALPVIVILGVSVLWGLPIRFFFSIYRTAGNLAMTQWLLNGSQVVSLLLMGGALLAGRGVVTLSATQLLGLLVFFLFCFIRLKKDLSWIHINLAGGEFQAIKEVAGLGFLFYVLTLANILTFQGSTLIVASLIGGAAVATFTIVRTLASFIRLGVEALSSALWPEITRMQEAGQLENLRVLHRLIIGGCLIFCTGMAGILWFEGESFLRTWTRGNLPSDQFLLRMMVLYYVLQVPWLGGYSLAVATNRHRTMVIAYFSAAVVGVMLVLFMVPRFGTASVPLGLMSAEVTICSYFILKDTCRNLGESHARFSFKVWFTVIFTVGLALLLSSGAHALLAGYPWLLRASVVGVLSFGVAAASTWLLWLGKAERERSRQILTPIYKAFASASA